MQFNLLSWCAEPEKTAGTATTAGRMCPLVVEGAPTRKRYTTVGCIGRIVLHVGDAMHILKLFVRLFVTGGDSEKAAQNVEAVRALRLAAETNPRSVRAQLTLAIHLLTAAVRSAAFWPCRYPCLRCSIVLTIMWRACNAEQGRKRAGTGRSSQRSTASFGVCLGKRSSWLRSACTSLSGTLPDDSWSAPQ